MINLTPHTIRVIANGETTTIPASGRVARVASTNEEAPDLECSYGAFTCVSPPVWSEVTGLEDEDLHQPILVSLLVAQRLQQEGYQGEVFSPDTSPASVIRSADGRTAGVRRLVRWTAKRPAMADGARPSQRCYW